MNSINPKLVNLLKRMRLLPRRSGKAFDRFYDACMLACKELGITNPAQIAYIFATVEHETNGTFEPVREAYWLSEANMIRWLRRNNKAYWHANAWGRGHIQLTWENNYRRADKHFELNGALIKNKDLMLEDFELSVATAVAGMKYGWFTGKNLEHYINDTTLDLRNARRIVNGTDKAVKIAKTSYKYIDLLPEIHFQKELDHYV